MRCHIAKSLQARCWAIQNAVKTYNTAAQALHPPRPTVDWSKVCHYSFLDEFNLLRDTCDDVQQKPWASPAVRETMKKARLIQHAKDEIYRCNIEVRRLHTSIVNENQDLEDRLQTLRSQQDPICGAVEEYVLYRRRVNAQIMSRIFQIYDLDGFTGNKTPGIRKGRVSEPSSSMDGNVETEERRAVEADDREEEAPMPGVDDEETDAITNLVEYMSAL
jgi:hypothetical protein